MGAAVIAPVCPTCGDRGVPILYGLPTAKARRAASAGRVKLAGCVMSAQPDQWCCAAAHQWRAGDEQLLVAAIEAALVGS
jgi:hypothetical protein